MVGDPAVGQDLPQQVGIATGTRLKRFANPGAFSYLILAHCPSRTPSARYRRLVEASRILDRPAQLRHPCADTSLQPGSDRPGIGIRLLAFQRPALRYPRAPDCICESPDASTHRTRQRKLNHRCSNSNFPKAPFDAPRTLAVREPSRTRGERAIDLYRLNVCIEGPIVDVSPEIPCE